MDMVSIGVWNGRSGLGGGKKMGDMSIEMDVMDDGDIKGIGPVHGYLGVIWQNDKL